MKDVAEKILLKLEGMVLGAAAILVFDHIQFEKRRGKYVKYSTYKESRR